MKLKVAELRAQLESRGLDSKGTKPTLVSRLQEAIDKDGKEDVHNIVESDSAGSMLGTPRKSRRLSGCMTEERPDTPTRKSRRLSGTFTEDRPETPTRKGRLLSGSVAPEDRPATPTRKSRRLSGGLDPVEERPLTPSRKSRRLSGAGEDNNILLEDQLEGLGSSGRRTSATARNKRISQLGGSTIATIPEVPEKENKVEGQIPELDEASEDAIAKDDTKKTTDSNKVVEDSTVKNSHGEDPARKENDETLNKEKIKDVAVETSGTELKEQENKNTGDAKANGTNTAADKENLPIANGTNTA